MNKIKYIFRFTLLMIFVSVTCVYSQESGEVGGKDKIIISGKTYYLHVVKKGEGFYGIAKKYGVSQKEIHEANPQAIFGLKPGDILHIPVISGRNSNPSEIEESAEFAYHTVEKGQTLYFLSRKYNVNIDEIKKYNAGLDQKLIIGAIIKIPIPQERYLNTSENGAYIYLLVKPKETLYSISQRYSVDIKDIIIANPGLKGGILKIDSKIRIPQSKIVKKDLPVKVNKTPLEDADYIYYRIKSGDTFYSIAKAYHLNQDVLDESNPDLRPDDLDIGYLVRIPKKAIKRNEDGNQSEEDFIIHSIRRKETLYSIAKKYEISVKDIKEANPTIMFSNIRKGTKLRIPTPAYLAKKKIEEEKLSIPEISDENIVQWDSIGVDCNEYNYEIGREQIKVAVLLPFNIEETKKANIITRIVDDKEVETTRKEPVLASKSKSFVEFYEGVLMAVDSMKKQGINIHLYTYDTAPDTNKVIEILNKPELKTMDFIIGPAYTSNLSLVSSFSYKYGIKMIYPLSNINSELNQNPYMFQVNSPESLLQDKYAEYIVSKHVNSRIIILKSKESDPEEEHLCELIKNKLYLKYLPNGILPDFKETTFSEQDVQGIEALMNKDKQNVVVVPSTKEADVSKIITTLHGVAESSISDIKLIGLGSWLRFQTINAEDIYDMNTEIITSYAIDYELKSTKDFILKFRQWYQTEPFAVSPYFIRPDRYSRFSKYGIWGFDIMYYFLNARVRYGKKFEYCISGLNSEQVQFNFHFKRSENWGGFYNDGLFILRFAPSLDIYRVPLQ